MKYCSLSDLNVSLGLFFSCSEFLGKCHPDCCYKYGSYQKECTGVYLTKTSVRLNLQANLSMSAYSYKVSSYKKIVCAVANNLRIFQLKSGNAC